MPIVLEDVARPLNPHEISKVFCSILAGVAAVDPDEVNGFGFVVELAQGIHSSADPAVILRAREMMHQRRPCLVSTRVDPVCGPVHAVGPGEPTWRTAFSATVAGFYGWCRPLDIELALAWVAENIGRLFPPDRPVVCS